MSISQIECQACGKFSFEFDPQDKCKYCHWPLTRTLDFDSAYGFEVMVEIAVNYPKTKKVERHFKGNETRARNQAKRVRNFVRVLAVRPYSEERYIAAFGEGRM